MPGTTVKPIQILPFPDGKQFTNNTYTNDTPIYDTNDIYKKYDHTGTFVISSSSYYDKNTMPYNVVNNNRETYWQCNSTANSYKFVPPVTAYSQTPYTNSAVGPSAYQGGGVTNQNLFTTQVGIDENHLTMVNGEWIQIEIPKTSPVYLFRYSILAPASSGGIDFFPKKFILVGSKDGIKWDYIDQRNLVDPPGDLSDRSPITFDVNSVEYYFFYRLIIGEMYTNNSIVRINQFNIFGMVEETPNRDAFTNMSDNKVMPYYDNHQYESPFSISNPVPDKKTNVDNGKYTPTSIELFDITSYVSIIMTIAVSAIILYSVKK
jgi:hypothetical protein